MTTKLRCSVCRSLNHRKGCPEKRRRRLQRSQRMQLCDKCSNPALRSSRLCQWHTASGQEPKGARRIAATRLRKREQRMVPTALFHLFFLYGNNLHHGTKSKWVGVSKTHFESFFSAQQVRPHWVKMQRWQETFLQGFPAEPTVIDMFFPASLPYLIGQQVRINGIFYRLGAEGLVRLGAFPFPQDFVHLQAFDGYVYDAASNSMVPATWRAYDDGSDEVVEHTFSNLSWMQVICQWRLCPSCCEKLE